MQSIHLQEKLFSISDFYKMVDAGIISYGDRIELIKGKVYHKPEESAKHHSYTKKLNSVFQKLTDDKVICSVKYPVHLDDYTELLPGFALLNYRADFYKNQHPKADDTLLIIEVSSSRTIEFDKTTKLQLYASAGIQEYWIVDINDAVIEIYRNPFGKKYKSNEIAEDDDEITITALNKKLKASDLLLK